MRITANFKTKKLTYSLDGNALPRKTKDFKEGAYYLFIRMVDVGNLVLLDPFQNQIEYQPLAENKVEQVQENLL